MSLPPLVLALLAFLAGLLPALRYQLPPFPCFLVAVGLLVAARAGARSYPLPGRLGGTLLLGAFAATGAALGAAHFIAPDCRSATPDRARLDVEGLLGAGVFMADSAEGSPLLPLERSRARSGPRECDAPIRAILPPGSPPAAAGSRVTLRGTWIHSTRPSTGSPWPEDPYRAGYLRADTVVAVAPPSLLHNPFLTLRGRSEQLLHDLFPGHFPLVEALILNRRERVDRAVQDRFAQAGLSHLLAISGSHVAILAGVLLVVGGMLPIPRRRITWVTIALVCLYLVLIGAPASAVRSGAMVSLVLLSSLLQRPSAILPIASAACLLIVALRPLAVLEVGLQLSFAGVFGIMAAQRTLGRHVARLGRGRPWLWLAETLLISAAAFLATAPITAYQFGTIAPVAIVANVPAIPLTGLALIGVLAAAAAAPIRPVADLLAAGTGLALDLLDRVATLAASIPYGSATVARPDFVAWAVAAVAGAALLGLARRGRVAVRAGVAGGTVAAVLVAWPVLGRSPAQGLEIHFLDVGQGDAVALRTPRGRWILVDAGPRSTDYDAGERRVVPFFRAHGVTRLEALVLTHPDADHIGGAAAVMRGLHVKRVIEPGVAVGKELYLEVLAEVEERGGQWIVARSGRSLRLDGIEMRFLWPDEEVVARAVDANDASAISIVTFGEFSIVLPGDASAEVERELVDRHGPALRSSVLKAGHHGSATSTSAEFLRAVAPELVVISAGRRNRYGHPAPEVMARLKEAGVEIARTDLEGTVSLRVPADGRTPWQRIGQ